MGLVSYGAQVHPVITPELMEGVILKLFLAINALTPADSALKSTLIEPLPPGST